MGRASVAISDAYRSPRDRSHTKGFRGMEGLVYLKFVHSGSDICRMREKGELGGFGLVSWDARKVGG
jgi:hypothetical protein